MKRILKRTVETIAEQIRTSHFSPEGYEISFSFVEDLESVNFILNKMPPPEMAEAARAILAVSHTIDTVPSIPGTILPMFHQVLEHYANAMERAGYHWFDVPEQEQERLMDEAIEETLGWDHSPLLAFFSPSTRNLRLLLGVTICSNPDSSSTLRGAKSGNIF